MKIITNLVWIIPIVFLPLSSQEKPIPATTDSGKKVLLFKDGTWKYETQKEVVSTPGKKYTKSELATSIIPTKVAEYSVWYNPAKWTIQKSEDPNKIFLSKKGSDVYAIIIPERMQIPLETLKELALANAQKASADIRITLEENRNVNGSSILCMQMEGKIKGISFAYYNYYFSGEGGVIQVVTYTSKNLFREFEGEMTEFLNGLVVK